MKIVKLLLMLIVTFALLGGLAYGLAKVGVIPVKKLAQKNPKIAPLLVKIKLLKPEDLIAKAPASAKLASKKAEKPASSASPKPAAKKKPDAPSAPQGPTGTDRLALIYSQLDAKKLAPIIGQMSDKEILELFRKMPDDLVGELLIALPPKKSLSLSRALAKQKNAR